MAAGKTIRLLEKARTRRIPALTRSLLFLAEQVLFPDAFNRRWRNDLVDARR
jgi:hypothetical protein